MTYVRELGHRVSACAAARGTTAAVALAAVAAVALCGALVLPSEAATAAAASGVEECEDAWEDAPAEGYCTDTSIARATSGSGWGNCLIEVSACSISVDVGGESITYTPTWPSAYTSTGDGLSVADTESIDICFASSTSASSGYTATVKSACGSSDTDSATATTDGLD